MKQDDKEPMIVELRSSAIRTVGYDRASRQMRITFTSGGTYTYFDVPAWKFAGLVAASSAGQYFNDHIRDQHSSN